MTTPSFVISEPPKAQIRPGVEFALQGRYENRHDSEGSRISWGTGAFGSDSKTEPEESKPAEMYPFVPAVFGEDIVINPRP